MRCPGHELGQPDEIGLLAHGLQVLLLDADQAECSCVCMQRKLDTWVVNSGKRMRHVPGLPDETSLQASLSDVHQAERSCVCMQRKLDTRVVNSGKRMRHEVITQINSTGSDMAVQCSEKNLDDVNVYQSFSQVL